MENSFAELMMKVCAFLFDCYDILMLLFLQKYIYYDSFVESLK